jgi:NADPH-dependent 2,4-dienoyl-CoA reductase/sulfur reductase-like enzyme
MTNYEYLIIGGGMSAAAAVDGIREADATGRIGLISAESDAPYNRPPLSKALWKGKPMDSIWRNIAEKRVELNLSCTIRSIAPDEKRVTNAQGDVFSYGKLLLATGGRPRRLSFEDAETIYFRTLSDYRRLRSLCETGQRFAVVGAGFIGSEIAAALALNGKQVVLIFPGQEIGERIFPRELAQYISRFYKQKGVELLAGEKVVASGPRGSQRVLTTASGRKVVVDGVVAGIGLDPNIDLAQSAGLAVEGGIVVDEFLCTSAPDVYAAGDCAAFYNPALGKRIRVEHEDNANSMGQAAGRNMAGQPEPYHHLPSFYSDMFELGYEAVGELDSRLETFADWKRPNEEGVIYYLKDGRVRGVLLWNVWGKVDAARELIAQPGPLTTDDLKNRIR